MDALHYTGRYMVYRVHTVTGYSVEVSWSHGKLGHWRIWEEQTENVGCGDNWEKNCLHVEEYCSEFYEPKILSLSYTSVVYEGIINS